jgi:Tol biopolymer transport system component
MKQSGMLAVLMTALVAVTPAAARPANHNGQIAFVRADPFVGHNVYTADPDGSHEQQLLPVAADLNSPRWSSDGTAIVADATGQGQGDAAWIVDADSGNHRAIPNPDPARFTFFFACNLPSPDFDRLACGGGGEAPTSNGIYTLRASDGGDLRQLTSNTFDDEVGDYSPDGKRLVYFHFNGWDDTGLRVLRVDGRGSRQIAPCCASPGSWSPQGNEIVFSLTSPAFDHHSTLWVVHSDGSGLRQIPLPQSFCGGPTDDSDARGCVNPVWSPDGRKILFRLTTPGFGEGGDLYTINADGTGLTQVTHDGDVDIADWGTRPLASGLSARS